MIIHVLCIKPFMSVDQNGDAYKGKIPIIGAIYKVQAVSSEWGYALIDFESGVYFSKEHFSLVIEIAPALFYNVYPKNRPFDAPQNRDLYLTRIEMCFSDKELIQGFRNLSRRDVYQLKTKDLQCQQHQPSSKSKFSWKTALQTLLRKLCFVERHTQKSNAAISGQKPLNEG